MVLTETESVRQLDRADVVGLDNLHRGSDTRDFWVWLDPRRGTVRRQVERHGCIVSLCAADEAAVALQRESEHRAAAWLTHGRLQPAELEQLLEVVRNGGFEAYPSRLTAMRLFRSEASAAAFRAHHLMEMRSHCLRRVHSQGAYVLSVHDLRWLVALRRSRHLATLAVDCACRYWLGTASRAPPPRGARLDAAAPCLEEVLFSGTVALYDSHLPLP
jgi:hypothetical protein